MTSWENELSNSITTIFELEKHIKLTQSEIKAFEDLNVQFKITPHLLHEITCHDEDGKLRRQYIPDIDNSSSSLKFEEDYLKESSHEISKNIIKRYPNKVILLVTNACAAYCQFCTRKRTINDVSRKCDLTEAYEYLKRNPDINDVVITGGDPLILKDCELENIFANLRNIPSIKFIRLNTRMPFVLPNRISDDLIDLLKKYEINYMNIHFEHPCELSQKTIDKCLKLANNGILLGSQSVLLKNVNDDCQTLKNLFSHLLLAKVKPYYLYQCDKITGCQPFYVDPIKGIHLINKILEELPGLCVPRFVIDAPGTMGKITIAPNGLIDSNESSLLLKNYNNNNSFLYEYADK